MNYREIAQEAENLLKIGRREAAIQLLKKLRADKIPRSQAPTLATLARRSGQLNLGLRIMAPIMRPKVPLTKEPTSAEKSCYALLLLVIGAIPEAIEILQSDRSKDPEISLALAFSHMKLWDYKAAALHLEEYLKAEHPPYARMIALVNLAAAYVAMEDEVRSKPILEEILRETESNNWTVLNMNALELSAQMQNHMSNYSEALKLLEQAEHKGVKAGHADQLWIKKWKSIVILQRDGANKQSLGEIEQTRDEAVKLHHWETVRHCDYHTAIANQDHRLCQKVYYGTPYQSFRDKLEETSKNWCSFEKFYDRHLGPEPSTRVFDLHSAQEFESDLKLKAGKGLHLALCCLNSDFYRPFVIGSLYSSIFAGEHFNPYSSPRRVAFLLHRLRSWFDENKVPLAITSTNEGYRLVSSQGSYAFRLYESSTVTHSSDEPVHFILMLEKLREFYSQQSFSASEAAGVLEVSIRTARYLLAWALENDHAKKIGSGRTTKYQFDT